MTSPVRKLISQQKVLVIPCVSRLFPESGPGCSVAVRHEKINKTVFSITRIILVFLITPFILLSEWIFTCFLHFFSLPLNSYDGSHGDQICDAATKPLKTSLSTKILYLERISNLHAITAHQNVH